MIFITILILLYETKQMSITIQITSYSTKKKKKKLSAVKGPSRHQVFGDLELFLWTTWTS